MKARPISLLAVLVLTLACCGELISGGKSAMAAPVLIVDPANIKKARASGYSDEQIINALSQNGQSYKKYLDEGYTASEIIRVLIEEELYNKLTPEEKFAETKMKAEAGDAEAQYALGWMYARGEGVPKDAAKEFEWFQKAAVQGYAKAQEGLGACYYFGIGVPKNAAKAVEWFQKAAVQGTAGAQLQLGLMYSRDGEGVPKNAAKAFEWVQKAAAQGYAGAQVVLGVMYYDGKGVPKNAAKAFEWYQKSAVQGKADAQYLLGEMYDTGDGVPKDAAKAVEWYQKAAAQGYADAQYLLGVIYATGDGVPKDYIKAVEWYQEAAAQGYAGAQYNLGVMYASGGGVPKDYIKAVEWFQKAAAQGFADAQYKLGLMYTIGYGVTDDRIRAYAWLNLAAAQGHEFAKTWLATLETEMLISPEQRIEAQRISTGWKKGDTFKNIRNIPGAQIQTRKSTENSSGSGVVVSASGYLLTNNHVVNGCTSLKIHDSAKLEHAVIVIATDAKSDLALLKTIKPMSLPAATFRADGSVESGESVVVLGYPLAGVLASEVNVSFGYVSATAGLADDTSKLQISAPVQPGNSGGPLLDQSGNLIGVVVSKLDALKVAKAIGDIPQNINFAVKGEIAQVFLKAHKVKFKSAASTNKLENTDLARRGREFTVLVECSK
jgi:TPR repeat protein